MIFVNGKCWFHDDQKTQILICCLPWPFLLTSLPCWGSWWPPPPPSRPQWPSDLYPEVQNQQLQPRNKMNRIVMLFYLGIMPSHPHPSFLVVGLFFVASHKLIIDKKLVYLSISSLLMTTPGPWIVCTLLMTSPGPWAVCTLLMIAPRSLSQCVPCWWPPRSLSSVYLVDDRPQVLEQRVPGWWPPPVLEKCVPCWWPPPGPWAVFTLLMTAPRSLSQATKGFIAEPLSGRVRTIECPDSISRTFSTSSK